MDEKDKDVENEDVYNEFMERVPEEETPEEIPKGEELTPEEKEKEKAVPLEFFEMIHDKENGNVTMSKATFEWFINKLN